MVFMKTLWQNRGENKCYMSFFYMEIGKNSSLAGKFPISYSIRLINNAHPQQIQISNGTNCPEKLSKYDYFLKKNMFSSIPRM